MQVDGNLSSTSIEFENPEMKIPVHISERIMKSELIRRLPPVRKTIRRNNKLLESSRMPVIMNINPRSIYNKSDELPLLIEQNETPV